MSTNTQALPSFDDQRVQRVYGLLCDTSEAAQAPDGEHWEGFTARRIVAALASPAAQPEQEPVAWRVRRHDAPEYWVVFQHKPVDALADPEREVQPLYSTPPAAQPVAVPACKVVDVGYRYDDSGRQHFPRLVIEFDPAPFNSPSDAKGWKDRDALAAMLAASPAAPVQAREPLTVPDGLARSDAEFWLDHRSQIIEACRTAGFTIVTTAHGVRLMRLGEIKAHGITKETNHG